VTSEPEDALVADDRVPQRLEDLLQFVESAARLVARGRDAYDADEMLQLAAESIVHKIGEAVSRLPDQFTRAHATVRWRPMKGMRNLIAHECEVIDYGILWNALEKELPKDAAAIRAIIDTMT
jgi:uncharacterized protein with HEPN domain